MTLHLKAETEDAGTRLDAFVASRANGLTRSQAARYIEEGRVSVDGKPAAKSCRIGGGETVITAFSPSGEPLGSFTAPLEAAAMSSCGSQLLVLFTGEESTLFSSALEEIVSYQPPEDVRQVFLCSDSRALFAGASGVVQIDFNR